MVYCSSYTRTNGTDPGDVVMKFVLALMLWSVNAAHAQSTPDCSEIRDAEERLRCFDKQYPAAERIESEPIKSKVAEPAAPEPVAPPVAKRKESIEAEAQNAKSSQQAPSTQQLEDDDDDADSFGRKLGGFFSKPTAGDLQSRVKTVRRRDRQKMVFLLENDQIWIQISPRDVPINVGDIVTIKNTRFGGYMLRTEGGTSTRVSRID